jgi:hypothetical protein
MRILIGDHVGAAGLHRNRTCQTEGIHRATRPAALSEPERTPARPFSDLMLLRYPPWTSQVWERRVDRSSGGAHRTTPRSAHLVPDRFDGLPSD